MKKQAECKVCGHAGSSNRPAGRNDIWECSHIDCPNRKQLTAGPSDGLAVDIDFNLTSHTPIKDHE